MSVKAFSLRTFDSEYNAAINFVLLVIMVAVCGLLIRDLLVIWYRAKFFDEDRDEG